MEKPQVTAMKRSAESMILVLQKDARDREFAGLALKELAGKSTTDRLKSAALGFLIQAAAIAQGQLQNDRPAIIQALKTVWELSAGVANGLNLSVGRVLGGEFESPEAMALAWAEAANGAKGGPASWALAQVCEIGGRFAKAVESLDHVEAYPSRQMIEKWTPQMAQASLAALAALDDFSLLAIVTAPQGPSQASAEQADTGGLERAPSQASVKPVKKTGPQ